MNRNRAWRRSQTNLKTFKAFRKIQAFESRYLSHDECVDNIRNENFEKAKRERDHMKMCSCPMCGNPRKWWNEVTIQERKAKDFADSQEF